MSYFPRRFFPSRFFPPTFFPSPVPVGGPVPLLLLSAEIQSGGGAVVLIFNQAATGVDVGDYTLHVTGVESYTFTSAVSVFGGTIWNLVLSKTVPGVNGISAPSFTLDYTSGTTTSSGGDLSSFSGFGITQDSDQPPRTPTSFGAVPTPSGIDLTWDNEDGVDSWLLYRGLAPNYSDATLYKTLARSSLGYNDVNTLDTYHYYYRLYATNNVSGASSPAEDSGVSQGPLTAGTGNLFGIGSPRAGGQ